MLASLSPSRRRLVVGVLSLTALALVAALIVLWRAQSNGVDPVPQGEPGPVLLVPGYGGSTSALQVLADALTANGRDATVVALAGDGTGDLREQAQVLDRAAEAALERTDARSVDVVGYSAGGVVARLWVAELGGGNVARRVVSLGSPQHGTDVAGIAAALAPDECPLACQQLTTSSDLLRSLNAGDETPDGPRWVSMWTTSDQLVVPPETAALDGGVNFSVQQVCGRRTIDHGDLPSSSEVINLTIKELGTEPPGLPSERDC